MLEFIGFVVVALIAWAAMKRFIGAAIQATLHRAEDYAVKYDVPREFARAICSNPPLLKAMRAKLAQGNREFAAQDVYVQYGDAILELHAAHQLTEGLADGVEDIVKPQIQALKAEGINVAVTDITFVYVGALCLALMKRAVSLEQIRNAASRVFRSAEYLPQLENAFAVVLASPDFFDKVAQLLPVAEKEVSAYLDKLAPVGEQDVSLAAADYYIRYTKCLNRHVEDMIQNSGSFDPRTARVGSFVDV